jgi:phage tail-like protein
MNPMKKSGLIGILVVGALVILAGTLTSAPKDQPVEYSYHVEIEGVDAGEFESVEGLSMEVEVTEYRDGSDNLVRKIPGRIKYGDVTLRKGWVASSILNNWVEQFRIGEGFERLTVAIVLYEHGKDSAGATEVKRWTCHNCFFSWWQLGEMEGKSAKLLTEELVVTIEWFEEG